MFSKSTEYAIRAIIFLSLRATPHKLIGTADIAHELGFPEAFLAKVLQNLVRKNLIVSIKGPGGGFCIEETTSNYSILDIVEVLEGLDFLNKCGLGLHNCSDEKPCPIHDEYQPVKQKIREALSSKTISIIKKDIAAGRYSMQFDLY
ncbi:MAG: Rrf2 family transcriptional regulator [Bacteroidota bacterium]